MAAKKVEIDWTKVGKYLQAQCSGSGIAGLLGIHENTLYERCKTDNGMEFMAYSAIKKGEGKELLRAKQFELAMNGNIAMTIWLGKQYLGQRDKSDVEQSGTTTQINVTVDSKETSDELKKIIDGTVLE